MIICTDCYKKLYHKMFSPKDYYATSEGLFSTCCDTPISVTFDGRYYHRMVQELEDKKKLAAWNADAVIEERR